MTNMVLLKDQKYGVITLFLWLKVTVLSGSYEN